MRVQNLFPNQGMGAPSNFAKTVAKPLSRKAYNSKDRKFDNYGKYLKWWQGKNPDWKREYGFFRGGAGAPKATERPVATTTNAGSGTLTGALKSAFTNPWDEYTKRLDQRETDLLERMLRARTQTGIDLFAAMQGFGSAATDAASEAWARATAAHGRASENQGAAQSAIADQYTLGLQQANEQIARDFAAIGQEGPANIRDTAAATQQVQSVGGADPASLMGLVGKNWESYAKTVPGSMTFMQQQNMDQARREAVADTDRIISEWQQGMLDNEETAVQLWQAKQKYQWDVEDRAQAKKDAAVKAKADALSQRMMINAYNLKYGAEYAKQADRLSDKTGYVYIYNPKTGQVEPMRDDKGNKVPTEDRRKAIAANKTRLKQIQATADTAKANRLSREEIARLGRVLRMDIAKMTKDEDKLAAMTPNAIYQMKKNAGDIVNKYYNGALYKDGKTVRIPRESPTKVLARLQALNLPPSVMLDAIAAMAWLPNEDRPDWLAARAWRRKPGT